MRGLPLAFRMRLREAWSLAATSQREPRHLLPVRCQPADATCFLELVMSAFYIINDTHRSISNQDERAGNGTRPCSLFLGSAFGLKILTKAGVLEFQCKGKCSCSSGRISSSMAITGLNALACDRTGVPPPPPLSGGMVENRVPFPVPLL